MWHVCDRRFWRGNLKAVPGIPEHRWVGDVKMYIKGIGWRVWIGLIWLMLWTSVGLY
jgi:hypothetical protein